MRIAIIGAGFSGLALAWHLNKHEDFDISIFDSKGIGGGASGIAAGLLHPYTGLHAKLNWQGLEGYSAALELLDEASTVNGAPVYERSGLLRIALNDQSKQDYAVCALKYKDVDWLSAEACQKIIPGLAYHPGIYIRSALTVNCRLYLNCLLKACKKTVFHQKTIGNLDQLKGYDKIVVAGGAESLNIPELKHLPLKPVKGQILELAWPDRLPVLSIPLNAMAYMIMNPCGSTCLVGATFERGVSDPAPDPDFAIAELLPKAIAMIPALHNSSVVSCRSGIRCVGPEHKPLVQYVRDNIWVLTGMGSKGLLYHALYAKQLAYQLASR